MFTTWWQDRKELRTYSYGLNRKKIGKVMTSMSHVHLAWLDVVHKEW